MSVNLETYNKLIAALRHDKVALVAVSKTKPVEDILELYAAGQRDFGENYVQELLAKQPSLPPDIRWHFIGHLQTNKVKYIVPFVHLIHGIDSYKLLAEVDKQAGKLKKVVSILLQVHIASEETKFGLDENELQAIFNNFQHGELRNVVARGMMGMASFSDDQDLVRKEFRSLRMLFEKYRVLAPSPEVFNVLSMGMSNDYRLAIEEGSTMVRIGSLLFGAREQHK